MCLGKNKKKERKKRKGGSGGDGVKVTLVELSGTSSLSGRNFKYLSKIRKNDPTYISSPLRDGSQPASRTDSLLYGQQAW